MKGGLKERGRPSAFTLECCPLLKRKMSEVTLSWYSVSKENDYECSLLPYLRLWVSLLLHVLFSCSRTMLMFDFSRCFPFTSRCVRYCSGRPRLSGSHGGDPSIRIDNLVWRCCGSVYRSELPTFALVTFTVVEERRRGRKRSWNGTRPRPKEVTPLRKYDRHFPILHPSFKILCQ